MQQIRIDFDNPGLPQSLGAVEGESQSRIFQAALYKSGAAYTAPAGAVYSIMYRGFGPQNQGWYDTIEDGAGKRAACTVSGNVVTCELARQALRVPGHLTVVLCVSDAKGYMLKSWPIMADVRNDGYEDTVEVESFFYITQITSAEWDKAFAAWEDFKATIDPTLTLSGKAADAKATGAAVDKLEDKKADKTDLDAERKRIDVLNEGGLNLKDEVIDTSIKTWLTEHPEATTTVQDGAITEEKINAEFLPYIKKDYITPQMFGAIGDGVNDDTKAVKKAFQLAEEKMCKLYFPSGTYKVQSPITTEASEIVLDRSAVLKYCGGSTDAFIIINGENDVVHNVRKHSFRGGKVDGSYAANTCLKINAGVGTKISECWISNFNQIGIFLNSGGCSIISCNISNEYSTSSQLPKNTTGIYTKNDNSIINTTIVDSSTGIEVVSGGVQCFNISVWLSTNFLFDGSIGYKLSSQNANLSLTACTVDTLQKGIVSTALYCKICAMHINWMFNTNVVNPDYAEKFDTTPTLVDMNGGVLLIYGLIGNLGKMAVKMLDDASYALYNSINLYAGQKKLYGSSLSGKKISNRIIESNRYKSASNVFVPESGFEINDKSHTYYMYNHIKGQLVLKKTSGLWSGLIAKTPYSPEIRLEMTCVFSPDGYTYGAIGSCLLESTGNLSLLGFQAEAISAYDYLIIFVDYIARFSSFE